MTLVELQRLPAELVGRGDAALGAPGEEVAQVELAVVDRLRRVAAVGEPLEVARHQDRQVVAHRSPAERRQRLKEDPCDYGTVRALVGVPDVRFRRLFRPSSAEMLLLLDLAAVSPGVNGGSSGGHPGVNGGSKLEPSGVKASIEGVKGSDRTVGFLQALPRR